MAVKITEMVAQRVDLANTLIAGIDTYLPEISAGYGDYLSAVREEGEAEIDTGLQLVSFRRHVVRHRDALESLDLSVLGQTHDDDKVSLEIRRLAGVVDFKMRAVRHTCKGVYGEQSLARVGLKGRFPGGASRLYRRGRLVQTSLVNPDLGLEPVLDFSNDEEGVITPAQLANQLEPELTDLGLLVEARRTDNREAADVRSRRRQTIKSFDREIGAIVRMTQGMFRLAGRPDLAARFRSTLRRVRRRRGKQAEKETVDETAAS